MPQAALSGVNAVVVGLLLAALDKPIWASTVNSPADFGLELVAFGFCCAGNFRRGLSLR